DNDTVPSLTSFEAEDTDAHATGVRERPPVDDPTLVPRGHRSLPSQPPRREEFQPLAHDEYQPPQRTPTPQPRREELRHTPVPRLGRGSGSQPISTGTDLGSVAEQLAGAGAGGDDDEGAHWQEQYDLVSNVEPDPLARAWDQRRARAFVWLWVSLALVTIGIGAGWIYRAQEQIGRASCRERV